MIVVSLASGDTIQAEEKMTDCVANQQTFKGVLSLCLLHRY